MKHFNVYRVLENILKDVDIYKDVEFPNMIPNEDEEIKCYLCEEFSSGYFWNIDVDDEPCCKECFLMDRHGFGNCDVCDDLIPKKYFFIQDPMMYYCLKCMREKDLELDEEGPLVCDSCYDKLEGKIKQKMDKLKSVDYEWDDFVYREALFSCDNCGEMCNCQRSDYCYHSGFDFLCYDCTHPGEKKLQEEFDKLKEKIERLELHIKFQPDGEGALEALRSFEKCQ